jgi:hypothetical protein
MKAIVQELHKLASVPNEPLDRRSISLVRYLVPNRNNQAVMDSLTASLVALKNVKADYTQEVRVNELLLVRLDKVADYFEVLHTFKLP